MQFFAHLTKIETKIIVRKLHKTQNALFLLSQNVFLTLVGYCFQYDYAVQRHSTSRRRL